MANAGTPRSNRAATRKANHVGRRKTNRRRTTDSSLTLQHLAQASIHRQKSFFARAADWTSRTAGSPRGFAVAIAVVVAWALTGPIFGFSDTWQLVVNTGTTIVTFLMIFLVQATQNRDAAAFHLKLDEIVRSLHGASNELLDMEERSVEELDEVRGNYEKLAEKARRGK